MKASEGFMYTEKEAELTQDEDWKLNLEIENIKSSLSQFGINTDDFSFIGGKMGTQRNPGALVIDIHVSPFCKDVEGKINKLRETLSYLGCSTNEIGEVTQIEFKRTN